MTAATGPNWYDVLDVDSSATTDEIRDAWRAAIADLTPADRRFRLYNEAAEVLLDADRRAAYDAEIGVAATTPEPTAPVSPERDAVDSDDEPIDEPDDTGDEPVAAGTGRTLPHVPGWLLAALALALVLVAGSATYVQASGDDGARVEDAASEATAAAKASVPLVFTYDYRFPDRDRERAFQVLTGDLKTQYSELWKKAIGPNLEKSKGYAKTTSATAGVACVSDDGERVGVLVVLDSEAGNVKQTQKLTLSFTATMVREGGDWLIEKIDGWDPRELTADRSGSGSASPTEDPGASAEGQDDASGASDCAAG